MNISSENPYPDINLVELQEKIHSGEVQKHKYIFIRDISLMLTTGVVLAVLLILAGEANCNNGAKELVLVALLLKVGIFPALCVVMYLLEAYEILEPRTISMLKIS